jgi:hypothetical protein
VECLDHLLIVGDGHLRRVLAGYVAHDNEARPHRGLDQRCPTPLPVAPDQGAVRRRNVLGGLGYEYYREAATQLRAASTMRDLRILQSHPCYKTPQRAIATPGRGA